MSTRILKKLNDEKRGALAAETVTEATLRRVEASEKDHEIPLWELILTPLEAELKLTRREISKPQKKQTEFCTS